MHLFIHLFVWKIMREIKFELSAPNYNKYEAMCVHVCVLIS